MSDSKLDGSLTIAVLQMLAKNPAFSSEAVNNLMASAKANPDEIERCDIAVKSRQYNLSKVTFTQVRKCAEIFTLSDLQYKIIMFMANSLLVSNYVQASTTYLSDIFNVTRKYILEALKELKARNLIFEVIPSKGKEAAVYELNPMYFNVTKRGFHYPDTLSSQGIKTDKYMMDNKEEADFLGYETSDAVYTLVKKNAYSTPDTVFSYSSLERNEKAEFMARMQALEIKNEFRRNSKFGA